MINISKKLIYLGEFPNCQKAVKKAKNEYDDADGCYYCCEPCHYS